MAQVDRYWPTGERPGIRELLAAAGVTVDQFAFASADIRNDLRRQLSAMASPRLQTLDRSLRVNLPVARPGRARLVSFNDVYMWAKVRRLIDQGMSETKACHVIALDTLDRAEQTAKHIDAFRKRFIDIKQRMTSVTQLWIATIGGLTVIHEEQEAVQYIEITGTLVAKVSIVFSGKPGFWIVDNKTSGTFSVQACITGGNTISLESAAPTRLFCADSKLSTSNAA